MYHVVNALILYCLSAVTIALIGVDLKVIIALLVSIICCSFNMVIANKKTAYFLCVIQVGIAYFVPELAVFMAIWTYILAQFKAYLVMGICTVAILPVLTGFDTLIFFFTIICSVNAIYLSQITMQNERLTNEAKKIRDDSEELSILLKDKNRRLIEKQDQEVYVATLKERNRIAREIHDNVGHILTRTILQMVALMTIHKEEPLHGQLTSVKENLDVAMNNVRESVHDLHDESVDMRQAVEEMMSDLKEQFTTFFEYDISKQVEKDVKYAFIGIVREAISNIIKHSKNDTVQIIMREHPGMYQLVVHDYKANNSEKKGNHYFDKVSKNGGIGLTNISDRVQSMNGNFTIDTSNGFRIFVTIPK